MRPINLSGRFCVIGSEKEALECALLLALVVLLLLLLALTSEPA